MSGQSWALPRWRRIALPASIVLNLFLVAVIGGHIWQSRRLEAGDGMPLARLLTNVQASLPPRDAAAFGDVVRRGFPRYAEDARAMLAARQELGREVTAEPFDKAQVKQALADWRTAWNRFMDDFGDTLVDALAQVSPEGRRKLVAERERRLRLLPDR